MGVLSSESVRKQILDLRSSGVTVNGHPERFASKAPGGWVLGKHAECSLAEIVGNRIGFENVVLNPRRAGDVDLLIKADYDYCIQVKSMNFFESKHFGEPMVEDLRWVSENVVEQTRRNIAYRGGFADEKRINFWEIPTESANVGLLKFQPTYFGIWNIRKKIHNQLRKAANQLRPNKSEDCRTIAAVDVRYFHAVGDKTYHDIVYDLMKENDSLDVIDYAQLISLDLSTENGGNLATSRIVPIPNPNANREIDVTVFADPPVQLYKVRPFVLPIKMEMDKGWNTVLQIEKGTLKVEGIPVMSIFS